MHTHSPTLVLLAFAALVASSPLPHPEPAPIDPNLASVIASNLNLGCINGCPAAASAQQLNANHALASAVNPFSLFGGAILAASVLAPI